MPPPRRTGLGRGLSALIPGGPEGTEARQLEDIPVASIRPNPHQPRVSFDEAALLSLAESVRAVGVLQPILVRPAGAGYELVAGERRWRAAQRAGLTHMPALIRDTPDAAALEQALIENLHREDLNPLEEAAAFQQLIEDFGLTHEDVGVRVGRSRPAVTNSLRLLQLPGPIQAHVVSGALSAGHGRALLALESGDEQVRMAQRVVRDDLSVRATEEAVTQHLSATPRGTEKRSAVARLRPPSLLEVEAQLSDHLDTRVRVQVGPRRGKIIIEFASLDDLERLRVLIANG